MQIASLPRYPIIYGNSDYERIFKITQTTEPKTQAVKLTQYTYLKLVYV